MDNLYDPIQREREEDARWEYAMEAMQDKILADDKAFEEVLQRTFEHEADAKSGAGHPDFADCVRAVLDGDPEPLAALVRHMAWVEAEEALDRFEAEDRIDD